jgi:hypothetical protein
MIASPSLRSAFRHLTYLMYLFITVTVGLEITLRLFFFDPNYYWNHRYLFASQGAFVNIGKKLWTYSPNRQIRTIAVYGFPGSGFWPGASFRVEYDCLYTTNNVGLVQGADVHPGEHATLVLGDSFTEGHGGCPWFYRVERRLHRMRLLNGGLQGSGPDQWEKLTAYLLSQGIRIDRVLIVAISNDFKRDSFVWPQALLDCMNLWRSCDPNAHWQPLHPNEGVGSILERSRQWASLRHRGVNNGRKVHELLLRSSYAYTFAYNIAHNTYRRATGPKGAEGTIHPEVAEAISSLRRLDNRLRVILVPQRDEVGMRQKNPDSISVEHLLNELSIPFEWCPLAGEHFMPLDGHPNAAGYNVLAGCVEAHLREGR